MKKLLKILLFFTVIVIGLFSMSLIGFLLLDHAHKIQSLSDFMQKNKICFMLWRFCLMGVIIYFYPHMLRYLYANREDINQEKLKKYSRRRYVIIVLVLIEILIVQNGLAWFINFLIN
jgi:hypothetical protein